MKSLCLLPLLLIWLAAGETAKTEMKFNQDLKVAGALTCEKLTVSSNAHFTSMQITKDVTADNVSTTNLSADELKVTRITSPTVWSV